MSSCDGRKPHHRDHRNHTLCVTGWLASQENKQRRPPTATKARGMSSCDGQRPHHRDHRKHTPRHRMARQPGELRKPTAHGQEGTGGCPAVMGESRTTGTTASTPYESQDGWPARQFKQHRLPTATKARGMSSHDGQQPHHRDHRKRILWATGWLASQAKYATPTAHGQEARGMSGYDGRQPHHRDHRKRIL